MIKLEHVQDLFDPATLASLADLLTGLAEDRDAHIYAGELSSVGRRNFRKQATDARVAAASLRELKIAVERTTRRPVRARKASR